MKIPLGNILKALRPVKTQREFAKEIGITASTLCRIENGEFPDVKTLVLICKKLNLDANYVLGIKWEE